MKPSAFALIVGTMLLCQAAPTVGDQPRAPWTTSRINGAPYPPAAYKIVPAFPNVSFKNPTCIEEIPEANRLLVTEIGGKIFGVLRNPDVHEADLIIDLAESAGGNVKVFDADFHPQFLQNGQLFVCYVHPGEGGHTRVSRFTMPDTSPPKIIPDSEQVIITWPMGGHNGGCLEFGKDGYLYISTGDGSGPNPPDGLTTGQDVSDLLGAVLRIDIDQIEGDRAYMVPADNPFVDLEGARPEIWAYGLRNPWKIGVDSVTGDVFAADNGWETWEMVHEIVRGGNCGWPVMEARAVLRSEVEVGPTPILPPIKDHPHTEANSVIGGPVYRGRKLPDLVGSFIYGDYITGTIWAVRADDDTYTHQTLVDTDQRITSFTEGSGGELYVLDYDFTGQIYELVPSGLEDNSADFPRRLSQTGLFQSLTTMQPAAGVIPYAVNVERWMDGGVINRRWVAIPGTESITLADLESPAIYPEGTVFVKHVIMGTKASAGDLVGGTSREVPLETQILHYENGKWHPYSYVWSNQVDDAGNPEAFLAGSAGGDQQINHYIDEYGIKRGPTWHISAENECRLCHNAGSGVVLGFTANQLDRLVYWPSTRSSGQLRALAEEHTITRMPTFPEGNPGRLVDPHDEKQPLDDRARSYLHGNCSSCHHPGGNAIVSFYLRRDLPFDKLNTNKGTGIGTFGIRNAKIIAPGDPYRSLLLYRMCKLGYGRMPYIGSGSVDDRGVALIEQWIRSLPHEDSDQDSTLVESGSRDAKALELLRQQHGGTQKILIDQEPAKFLFESTAVALAVALGMHGDSINRVDLGTARLRTDGDLKGTGTFRQSGAMQRMPSDIRGLFDDFIPASMRRRTLGQYIDPNTVLDLVGDATRGKLIYFSDGSRCKACHDPRDASKSIGTTLVEINKKYKQPAEMLQHVLKPSLKIDEPFAAYAVNTAGGKVITGLLAEKTDEAVVIKTAERKLIRIPTDEIDAVQKSPKSLMPDQILSDLTAQEAADLFAYIRSLGAAE